MLDNLEDIENSKIVNLNSMVESLNDSREVKNIYFVKMNEEDIVNNNIAGTSHVVRPFVVLEEIDDDNMRGCYTTSNLKELSITKKCFTKYRTVLSTNKYSLKTASIVLIDRCAIINRKNIIRKVDSVDDVDFVKIFKMNSLFNGINVLLRGKNLSEGDVIEVGVSKYLIYNRDSSFAYGLKIEFKAPLARCKIDFNTTFDYFIDADESDVYRAYFNDYIKVSNNDEIVLCDHLSEDVIFDIKSIRCRRKHIKKKTKVKK